MAGSGQVGKERRIITWFLTFTFVKAQEGSRTGEGEGGVGRDRLTRNLALPRARCNSWTFFRFVKSINSLFKIKLVWSGFNLLLKKSQ